MDNFGISPPRGLASLGGGNPMALEDQAEMSQLVVDFSPKYWGMHQLNQQSLHV